MLPWGLSIEISINAATAQARRVPKAAMRILDVLGELLERAGTGREAPEEPARIERLLLRKTKQAATMQRKKTGSAMSSWKPQGTPLAR